MSVSRQILGLCFAVSLSVQFCSAQYIVAIFDEGKAAQAKKDYSSAEKLYRKSLTIVSATDPKRCVVLQSLIEVLFAQSKLEEARPVYSELVDLLTISKNPQAETARQNYNKLLEAIKKRKTSERNMSTSDADIRVTVLPTPIYSENTVEAARWKQQPYRLEFQNTSKETYEDVSATIVLFDGPTHIDSTKQFLTFLKPGERRTVEGAFRSKPAFIPIIKVVEIAMRRSDGKWEFLPTH